MASPDVRVLTGTITNTYVHMILNAVSKMSFVAIFSILNGFSLDFHGVHPS